MSYSTVSQARVLTGLTTTEISDDSLTVLIGFADAEIDNLFNRRFENGTSFTEYISIYPPKRADDIVANRLTLSKYPIQSITEFLLVGSTSTTNTTLATISTGISENNWQTANYFIDPTTGIIEIDTNTIQLVPSRAKISGTYGYDTTPVYVQKLSAVMAGIMGWVNFLGGNYDRLNSYKLPEQEYNKGDFYDRGMKSVDRLSMQANDLVGLIGSKYVTQIAFTSSGYF